MRDNTVYNDGNTDSYSSDDDEDEYPTVCDAAISEKDFKDIEMISRCSSVVLS